MTAMIVPHPDDEIIYGSGMLLAVDEIVTLTYSADSERGREQLDLAKVMGYRVMNLNMHDEYTWDCPVHILEKVLFFARHHYDEVVVPECRNHNHRLHASLNLWAEVFLPKAIYIAYPKRPDFKGTFERYFPSQRKTLEDRPELFDKDKLDWFYIWNKV